MIELTGNRVNFEGRQHAPETVLIGLSRGMINPDSFYWNGQQVTRWQFIALLELSI